MLTEMLPGMRHARRGMLLQRLPIMDGVLAKVIPPFLVVEIDGLVVAGEVGELAEEKKKMYSNSLTVNLQRPERKKTTHRIIAATLQVASPIVFNFNSLVWQKAALKYCSAFPDCHCLRYLLHETDFWLCQMDVAIFFPVSFSLFWLT